MSSKLSASKLALACSLLFPAAAFADVTPASLFTDHAVLQEGKTVPIWGTASPGEKITVSIQNHTQSTTTSPDGHWRIDLPPLSEGGPLDLTITGNNTLTLRDIYIGEVWLCSGQSNMDFTVAKTKKRSFAGTKNADEEIANANYPTIRMFTGDWTRAYTPQQSVPGTWKVCTPENVPDFSAIGYFFARDLQKAIHRPIGIITMTYGASTAQAWVRREPLENDPALKPMVEAFDKEVAAYREKLATSQPAPASEPTTRKSRTPRDPVQNQHNPTVMFNGMIAPIIPYTIQGVLWYQGESITGDHALFPKINATLINDWRSLWHNPDLPFFFCQLAALKNNSNSPEVRALQAQALEIPNTAMAVTIDIGDPKSVHPKNKQDVGDRLSRIARAKVYGEKIEYAGPVYENMTTEGNTLRLHFSHAEGLTAKNGPLKTFEIAGPDGKFVEATATIDGDNVLVSSPEIPHPTAARYAWDNYPEGCNLYNAANLPAAPFRTDAPTPNTNSK